MRGCIKKLLATLVGWSNLIYPAVQQFAPEKWWLEDDPFLWWPGHPYETHETIPILQSQPLPTPPEACKAMGATKQRDQLLQHNTGLPALSTWLVELRQVGLWFWWVWKLSDEGQLGDGWVVGCWLWLWWLLGCWLLLVVGCGGGCGGGSGCWLWLWLWLVWWLCLLVVVVVVVGLLGCWLLLVVGCGCGCGGGCGGGCGCGCGCGGGGGGGGCCCCCCWIFVSWANISRNGGAGFRGVFEANGGKWRDPC